MRMFTAVLQCRKPTVRRHELPIASGGVAHAVLLRAWTSKAESRDLRQESQRKTCQGPEVQTKLDHPHGPPITLEISQPWRERDRADTKTHRRAVHGGESRVRYDRKGLSTTAGGTTSAAILFALRRGTAAPPLLAASPPLRLLSITTHHSRGSTLLLKSLGLPLNSQLSSFSCPKTHETHPGPRAPPKT